MTLTVALALLFAVACGRVSLAGSVQLDPATGPVIHADLREVLRARVTPAFLGLNVNWRNFQVGYWRDGKVVPEVVELMAALPGVIYRYPGGTISNGFIVERAVGPSDGRRPQAVPNGPPMAAQFGPAEFLAFVAEVGGIPVFVLNLHGARDEVWPVDLVAAQARRLAEMFGARGGSEPAVGRNIAKPCTPDVPCAIGLWELGNELDIAPYRWTAETYGARARAVMDAVRGVSPNARFVAALATAPWSKRNDRAQVPARFNETVAEELGDQVYAYAFHAYYDGLSIPAVMESLRAAVGQVRNGQGRAVPRVLVTEHARWPNRPPRGRWEDTWHKTGDLSGALATADFLLAALNQPEVDAALWHALGARGPWQLLKRSRDGDRVYGNVVYWALRVLHGAMEGTLIRSATSSPNRSGYRGGYDVRAAVVLNEAARRVTLLTVNRHDEAQRARLVVPQLAGQRVAATQHFISAPLESAANRDDEPHAVTAATRSLAVEFDSAGVGHVELPPNSVAASKLMPERIL